MCAAVLAAQGLYSLVLVPAAPSLLGRNPVLLEALRASTAAMVAGGAFARVGRASLALALVAPLPTLLMSDPFLWWAGRLWGPDVVRFFGGGDPRRAPHRARPALAGALRRAGRWCSPTCCRSRAR